MNLSSDNVANRELSASELDAASAGLHLSFGPNPPRGGEYSGEYGGGCHQEPHRGCEPHQGGPREFPGGVPNDPALNPHFW